MEKGQATPPKTSFLAILAPFFCLLPLNVASVFVRNISSHISTSPFYANDKIVLAIIANLLILRISYKRFPLYMNISIKNTILWEILLTFILLLTEFITFIERTSGGNKSWQRLWLYPICLFVYSLIWPIFKLRYQLYLHKWSENSNRAMIYTSAICIQMLPNVLGRMIASLSPHRLFHELILLYLWLILGLLVSLALYFWCNKMNYSPPETLSEEIEKAKLPEEGKKTLKDVFQSKKLLYLFVICAFCGMNENISQSFVKLEDYPGREPGYIPIELFEFSSQILFLSCEIGKAVIVAGFDSFFGKFNKKKILNILMIGLFGITALYYYLMISKSKRDFVLVAILGKQGLSELIHLGVQLVISQKFNGSPEVFFASNAFFSFGDLVKRIIDPLVLGWVPGWTLFLLIIFIPAAVYLGAYFLTVAERKIKLG